jgi:uncharacterized membrane protein YhaH (DUF805 family)
VQKLNAVEWALRPVKNYAVFSGRAARAEYWWFYLGTMIVGIPVAILDSIVGDTGALSGAYNVALLLPWVGVTVRRLHDTDRSAWWLLLFFVPFFIAGFIAAVAVGARLDGADSDPFSSMGPPMILAIIVLIILAVLLLVFMVLPGTRGPNRYGPDPYDDGSDLGEVFA